MLRVRVSGYCTVGLGLGLRVARVSERVFFNLKVQSETTSFSRVRVKLGLGLGVNLKCQG